MSRVDFASLLQHAIGLDAASIGSSAIELAVKGRMSACEIDDASAYRALLRTSQTELQALIEAVIVPETWFFRDREAYAELTRVVNEDWLPSHPAGSLRLLSLPCSSGEEPFSMAMALLDSGFPADRFRIDAVDISAHALTHARRALYGRNSFRGGDLEFRDHYFETTALGSRLSDTVRGQVDFAHGNLLADGFVPGAEIYDIIFCRNLLIYFDRTTRNRAVAVLQRLLKPAGVLCVGPSEGGLLLSHGFVSSKVPFAFAFRRSGAQARATVPAPAGAAGQNAAAPLRNGASGPRTPIGSVPEEAVRLADLGRLAEAAKACEEHLREYGPSVQSFFLMGLIRAAAGDLAQASQYYRKALYLDPHHHDTLAHLGLLLEEQGDAPGAQVLSERLRRQRCKRTA